MHNERCRERRTLVTLSRTLGLVLWGDCVHGASVLVTFSKHLEREREREKGGTRWVHIVGLIFVSARTNKRHHHRTNFLGETCQIVGKPNDDHPFIVLTETKFSFRCIPVWIGTLL